MNTTTQWLEIEKLGSQGEGIAYDALGPIYIPGALPGERVLAQPYFRRGKQRAAKIIERENDAPSRGQPFCEFAARCGGCATQHMSEIAYKDWKYALAQVALPETIKPQFVFWGGQAQRRRVSLSYKYGKDGLQLGFFEALSHFLVPITKCPLLTPMLNKAITDLRAFLPSIIKPKEEGFVHLTETLQGLDLSWSPHRFKSQDLTTELWQAWGRFGQEAGCARITRAAKDMIAQWEQPYVDLGGVAIAFPAASFLQPSLESQTAMQQQLLKGLEQRGLLGSGRIADLFCGLGTFTVPFFQRPEMKVDSFDITGPAIEALAAIAPAHITAVERNLFTEPLTPHELAAFDVVLFDPPRAGAGAQAANLANSNLKAIAMISCDLGTASRDIALLAQGGYVLEEAFFFDQFPYTAHLEVLCWFRKKD